MDISSNELEVGVVVARGVLEIAGAKVEIPRLLSKEGRAGVME